MEVPEVAAMKKQNNPPGDPKMLNHSMPEEKHTYHSLVEEGFALEGMPYYAENQDFYRLPHRLRSFIRSSLDWVAAQPSGGVIRFKTNSTQLSVKVQIDRNEHFPERNTLGQDSGFDCYIELSGRLTFHKNLVAVTKDDRYIASCGLPDGTKQVVLYFPLLNPVLDIQIGLSAGATISPPPPHSVKKPILFYGSSITQGFSCSRPGLTYPAMVCRKLGAPLINFGFGGNCKGDMEIAECIASLDISALVLDYDHNTPSVAWLEQTYAPFYQHVRKHNPDLPILLLSSPNWHADAEFFNKRMAVIQQTFETARKNGDDKVMFIPGKTFYPEQDWFDYTVDRLHPNDAGFRRIAEVVAPELESLIGTGR